MTEPPISSQDDPLALRAEIARLRGEVARLERQVGELDRLAHHDSLVPLPNRRGFERQLASLLDRGYLGYFRPLDIADRVVSDRERLGSLPHL